MSRNMNTNHHSHQHDHQVDNHHHHHANGLVGWVAALFGLHTHSHDHRQLAADRAFRENEEGIRTVGGFIVHLFGRIPKSGESVKYRNYAFSADDVRKNRIRKITVKKEPK